jgi:ABC-2 type transport system ATP-binding protein
MSAVVSTVKLTKSYGKHVAVTDVTFDVPQGSVVGLIGPNGAGKTTVLRMLVDIIRPTSGTVTVLGHAPRTSSPALRERIGYLPGELKMSTRATAKQVLRFFAEVSGPVAPGAMGQWADRFGLDLSRPVNDLSKGNKQKLGLIQALMHTPDLLILDEPTSGLDPLIQREFLQVLSEVRASGRTVLLSSHVLGEIQQAADHVAVLSQGRLVANGPVASLALARYKKVRVVVPHEHEPSLRLRLGALGVSAEIQTSPVGADALALEFRFSEDVNRLVSAVAGVSVDDVTITEPDLAEAVLDLYDGTPHREARHG